MVEPRTTKQLELMQKSGQIAAAALKKALENIKVGATGIEIDKIAEQEIYKLGGDLSYKTVPGYKYATCVTVNEQVVHGIPTKRKFEKGDLVSVDLATTYQGWHTDTAWTVIVEDESSKEKINFLKVGRESLKSAIKEAVAGNRVGDISYAIQTSVEGSGYHVVRSLVGHGVGRQLHEDPEIPGYGRSGIGLLLKEGMTLAIEVIYAKGSGEVVLEDDGWTYKTADGSLSGLFEMTVVVGKKEAKVLTDWRRIKEGYGVVF